jgi:uncharacterized YkwD family protein
MYLTATSTQSKKESTVVGLDQSPQLIQNRTMIPLRVAGESFGYQVNWDGKKNQVNLKYTSSLKTENSTFPEYKYIPSDKYEPNEEELEVFFITNYDRERNGKEPLALNAALSNVAHQKSLDLYENHYFDHTSPEYGSPFEMMTTFGITYHMAGENIAAGQQNSVEVVGAWMDSPGHRENILNSSFTQIGVGHVQKNGGYGTYWTQMFISP